jgi:hypothetical protein
MTASHVKADLHRYLQGARDALLWKLNGLSDYDIPPSRRPDRHEPAGLIKHMVGLELGYFGYTFGRPFAESLPWLDDAELVTVPLAGLGELEVERLSVRRNRFAVGQGHLPVNVPLALVTTVIQSSPPNWIGYGVCTRTSGNIRTSCCIAAPWACRP